jgi:hypothetical protein
MLLTLLRAIRADVVEIRTDIAEIKAEVAKIKERLGLLVGAADDKKRFIVD